MVKLIFPVPNGCMECPLSNADEMGYPIECKYEACPFQKDGSYIFDPETLEIKKCEENAAPCIETVYSVRMIADILHVDLETVRRWIRKNELTARKKSRKGGYAIFYGDLSGFCLKNPKYLRYIQKIVTRKGM